MLRAMCNELLRRTHREAQNHTILLELLLPLRQCLFGMPRGGRERCVRGRALVGLRAVHVVSALRGGVDVPL